MISNSTSDISQLMKDKSHWVWKETLKIHKLAPETRIASSLSPIDILVALYYGKVINYDPKNIKWEGRDRFIISKGHGSISFYPILADLGFFSMEELGRVCGKGSFLGGIPDCIIPGYETTNGSLGHGLGVACGISMALKRRNRKEKVFVLIGDGELYEGSVWEAVMFAGEHKLDNLILIVDNNRICMLDYCANIINMEPLAEKFKAFNWRAESVDGHNVDKLYDVLMTLKEEQSGKPKILIANTIKGKGVPSLESNVLCHIKSLKPEEVDALLEEKK